LKQYIRRKHGESTYAVRSINVYYALLWITMTENMSWTSTFYYSRVEIFFSEKKYAYHPFRRLGKEE